MMTKRIKLGMIGLDTSHVTAFTELLNRPEHPYYVPGGEVAVAYPGGSPDMEISISRVAGFTNELRDKYGVAIVDTPEVVAESSDAILLESVDGRVHLEQFRRIAPYGKPTFIDKPFATTYADALAIAELAKQYRVPLMSSSSLRYAAGLTETLDRADAGDGAIIGADCFGPTAHDKAMPGLFNYGIHTVEMLYAIMGPGCMHVTSQTNADYDLVTGVWQDGRIGTVRGNRKGNYRFGAVIHREKSVAFADVSAHPKPLYASLLEQVIGLFRTGEPPLALGETVEIIRFIEAANESGATGKTVVLRER